MATHQRGRTMAYKLKPKGGMILAKIPFDFPYQGYSVIFLPVTATETVPVLSTDTCSVHDLCRSIYAAVCPLKSRCSVECFAIITASWSVSSIQDPDSLADHLFSRHLLGAGMMHELQVDGLSQWKKTRKILLAVQDQIAVHPEKFGEFVEALHSDSSMDYLANKLMRACVSRAQGVQETLAELRGFYAWFPLGLCLGVPKEKLRAIYIEHREGYDAVGRCLAKVIEAWLEMKRDANWRTLATALWQTGRRRLAARMAEKFGFRNQFLRTPIPDHHSFQRDGAEEWRTKLERLDQELAKDQQEFVDNEREKQLIERELSEGSEHLEATGKYLKLLQLEKAQLSFALGEAKYKLQMMLLLPVQSEQQIRDDKMVIQSLEERIASLMERIEKTKLELRSIRDSMSALTSSFSELSTRQKRLQEKKCVLLATLRQHEEALNGSMPGEPVVIPPQSEVSYYNVTITAAGIVEVKLRQSEIELIERKMKQKETEVSLLSEQLLQLETKIQKLEQHLRSQKTGDAEYSELELLRLQTERLLTRKSISTADSQKHGLQCEKKMQAQEITSIEKELSSKKETGEYSKLHVEPRSSPIYGSNNGTSPFLLQTNAFLNPLYTEAFTGVDNLSSVHGQPHVGSAGNGVFHVKDSLQHDCEYEEISSAHAENIAEKVVVIYGYEAQGPLELTLKEGDVIMVMDRENATWWKGKLNGRIGMFPADYVEPHKASSSH